jgi:hypothetical protein
MSTPNNNEIINEETTSPWVTIEGTIMTNAKTGTKRLKLNAICYRQFKTRRFISGNSGFLPVISLNEYPEENYIEFSGISNQPNSPKETNDSELLSKFSGHNIYSLGSNENYDTDASNNYKSAYKKWVDLIRYWADTDQIKNVSSENIAIVNGELEKAKNELKPIEKEITALKNTQTDPLNDLERESTNMGIKVETLNKYLDYLKSSAYQERNKNLSNSAQEYLDKVEKPDNSKIYINCVYFYIREKNEDVFYLMDINGTVSFSKYGLVPKKDNSQKKMEDAAILIQQMKNIKIENQSLNNVIQHYKRLKRAKPTNNTGSQSTSSLLKLKNSVLNPDFGNFNINSLIPTLSGGRRKYTNKNPKYKRRKYSVKNK